MSCCPRIATKRGLKSDVDRDVSIGTQHDGLAPQDDRAGHIECPPGVVRGLVQLRHRLVDRVVRPDEIDDLLSVQTPPRRQRENFDECGRVTSLPVGVGDFHPVDLHGETAEQRDFDRRHRTSASHRLVCHHAIAAMATRLPA